MHSVISSMNLMDSDIFPTIKKDNRSDRGYNEKSLLTGQLLLLQERCGSININDITNEYCKSNVQLYLEKGKNKAKYKRKKAISKHNTILGQLIEEFVMASMNADFPNTPRPYNELISQCDLHHASFLQTNNDRIKKMIGMEGVPETNRTAEKIIDGIRYCSRYELLFRILQHYFDNDSEIFPTPQKIHPKKELGVGKEAAPDFLIKVGQNIIIGDIKTGENFEDYHKLLATGYALAYESQHEIDVNFGIIYFIPTRKVALKSKNHFIFPQIHLFEIDSSLRRDFIGLRNQKYEIISNDQIPNFPSDKTRCHSSCKYSKNCSELLNEMGGTS
jgi:CRISPR/Cas system-associated exonuclease Cas4 (RecB family)